MKMKHNKNQRFLSFPILGKEKNKIGKKNK